MNNEWISSTFCLYLRARACPPGKNPTSLWMRFLLGPHFPLLRQNLFLESCIFHYICLHEFLTTNWVSWWENESSYIVLIKLICQLAVTKFFQGAEKDIHIKYSPCSCTSRRIPNKVPVPTHKLYASGLSSMQAKLLKHIRIIKGKKKEIKKKKLPSIQFVI